MLESLAKRIVVGSFLFLGQMIGVIVITVAIGGSFPLGPPQIGSVGMLLQFTPSLLGILLGLGVYQWKLLRSSGQWIWVPGLALTLAVGFERGIANMPRRLWDEFFGDNPVGVLMNSLTLSCALYSLTLFALSRWETRRQAHDITTRGEG